MRQGGLVGVRQSLWLAPKDHATREYHLDDANRQDRPEGGPQKCKKDDVHCWVIVRQSTSPLHFVQQLYVCLIVTKCVVWIETGGCSRARTLLQVCEADLQRQPPLMMPFIPGSETPVFFATSPVTASSGLLLVSLRGFFRLCIPGPIRDLLKDWKS